MAKSDENQKKVVFYDTDKRHAELKISLHHDGLTQSEFFRSLVSGYIEKDENIFNFIERIKDTKSRGADKRKKTRRLYEKAKDTKNKFALDKEDIENIFDLIEEEGTGL
jgi:hypothetical protein